MSDNDSEEESQTVDSEVKYREKIANRTWDEIVHPALESEDREKVLFEGVIKVLEMYFSLKEDDIFAMLIQNVKNQLGKDMELHEAIRYIIQKRKYRVLQIFNDYNK